MSCYVVAYRLLVCGSSVPCDVHVHHKQNWVLSPLVHLARALLLLGQLELRACGVVGVRICVHGAALE
jgi:hypothetical protein